MSNTIRSWHFCPQVRQVFQVDSFPYSQFCLFFRGLRIPTCLHSPQRPAVSPLCILLARAVLSVWFVAPSSSARGTWRCFHPHSAPLGSHPGAPKRSSLGVTHVQSSARRSGLGVIHVQSSTRRSGVFPVPDTPSSLALPSKQPHQRTHVRLSKWSCMAPFLRLEARNP